MPLFDFIKAPLKLALKPAAKIGRFVEMAAPSIWHPEQILSKSEAGQRLFNFTVKEQHATRMLTEKYKKELMSLVKKYDLNDENRVNQFLEFLEFPVKQGRMPTIEEIGQYPRDLVEATSEYLRKITDPIWETAKANNPDLGYIKGYFTHFPLKSMKNTLEDEISRIAKLREATDPVYAETIAKYDRELQPLMEKLAKVNKLNEQIQNASLNALHYKQLPGGGHFGPLDEARVMASEMGYRMDFKDVMEEYIEKAFRKIFLDRYMKPATRLMNSEPNQALREYMFDYITAQRGALSAQRKVFWNEAWNQLFPNPEKGYGTIAKAVDYTTRFQYLSKIGLSWFRFPLVNMTQPLLMTYPMVGSKIFTKAYMETFMNPAIWREAKDAGVIFEATLRKGITELLGRGTKLTKVEKSLSWPAQFSEELNRVVSYSAGKMKAAKLGLMGQDAVDYAIKLVNRTQGLYHKEAMPLIMSKSPAGRLMFQFRTFTMNYINFLTQMIREGNHAGFARALGSLGVLAGSSAIPFNLWDATRRGLLRNAGVDIGEFNPIEYSTSLAGISPPVNFGKSLEPFNVPRDAYDLFGPTVGPILRTVLEIAQRPEEAGDKMEQFMNSIAPPVTAAVRGFVQPTVRTEPSETYKQGREVGKRSLTETLMLRPSLEATRQKYIELIANAYAGGRPDVAARLIVEGRKKYGLRLDVKDIGTAKARGKKLKGVKEPEPVSESTPMVVPMGQQMNMAPTPITMDKVGG